MGSNNIVINENGSHAAPSVDFRTISEFLEVYDLSPLVALEWVWSKPDLRKILIKRAWREMVKSEYGKIGAAARNAKVNKEEREECARHGNRARWKKADLGIARRAALASHTNGVVREEQVAN